MLKAALIVGLGSFFGGGLRYLIAAYSAKKWESDFPLGILLVNVLGSFAIGFFAPLFAKYNIMGDQSLPLFLSVGVLGGFTTFSTFSLQTMKLMQNGQLGLAFANAGFSLIGCLVSVFLGLKLAGTLFE